MKKEVTIMKQSFKSENGVEHYYNAITLEIGGKSFNLFARADDKKLLNYLIDQELQDEEDEE